MICSSCKRNANDHAAAYYDVSDRDNGETRAIWKCWFCLSPKEKIERDPVVQTARRFTVDKTIMETTEQ